ncbi:MAG: hypothetical protein ILO68_07610, partial [Clostridia bacterium]|nr:hypothetical protein [Clostridia bacterium]
MKKKTILLILALVCLLALSAAAAACGHTPQPQGTSPDAGTSSVPADPAESSPSALDDPAVPENSQSAEAPAPSADPTEESPETGASAPAEGSDAEPVEESGKPAKEESREEKPVSEDPAPPVSQDPVSEPADPVYSEEIQFLTRQTFSSSRVKKDVSQAFRSGYAQTALNLLKQSANGKGALISPLSILTALQMTANGAKGRTLEEMQAVLCGMDTEDLNQQLFNYYEGLENTEDASLNVSNAIWLTSRTDFHVNPDFIGLMNNTFRAQIATAPLHMQST